MRRSTRHSRPSNSILTVQTAMRLDHYHSAWYLNILNQSTEDWYTHAATFVCSSAAIFSTAAVTAGS
jgi:hypothetical protein